MHLIGFGDAKDELGNGAIFVAGHVRVQRSIALLLDLLLGHHENLCGSVPRLFSYLTFMIQTRLQMHRFEQAGQNVEAWHWARNSL